MNEGEVEVRQDELESIRGDIRAIVARLDRLIGDDSDETNPALS